EVARLVRASATLLREGNAALEAALGKSLSELRRASVGVRLPSLDEERLRHALKELLATELDAKAEIERRSFWRRLGQGRQLVFTVLMSVSLFGSVLPFTRKDILAWYILLPLFTTGFLLTFRTWRREDRERLERELERMQEQLKAQLLRRSGDALRE